MFRKRKNKNSEQNLEIAKEYGRNKVNKEDDTVSNSGGAGLRRPRDSILTIMISNSERIMWIISSRPITKDRIIIGKSERTMSTWNLARRIAARRNSILSKFSEI